MKQQALASLERLHLVSPLFLNCSILIPPINCNALAIAPLSMMVHPSAVTTGLTAERMLRLVLDTLPVGLFWKDCDSRILGCNLKFAQDSGVSEPSQMIGKTNFDAYPAEQAEGYRADDVEVMTTGRPKLGIEEPLLLANGETAWVETNKVPIHDAAGKVIGLLGTYRDVTDRRRAGDDRMRHSLELAAANQAAAMAMHDALTGLPNRRYLREKLMARQVIGSNGSLAIVALDLDRFKAINDLYGHAVGDELLQKVTSLLKEELGPQGFIARMGGDEFILLLEFTSRAGLLRQLSALIAKFEAPIELTDHEVVIGATLGVAITPNDGVDPIILIRRADMALYRAKEQGRARLALFEPGMEARAEERVLLERDLRSAVKQDQIIPFYQPLVQLGTGHVLGYEVLARWPHANRGLIPPVQFIKIAADTGLIGALMMNLLRRACCEAAHWQGSPRIAINIAPVQLHDAALPEKILMVLSECGFPPARLEIEVTEDAFVCNLDAARAILTSLKNQGVTIALDDFGTGYSSLKHLSDLPLDSLKIDKSFVQSMENSRDALMIVKAILQLAQNLGLEVTAEGIETESQARLLRELGCERGQGFFLGPPLPGGVGIGAYPNAFRDVEKNRAARIKLNAA